jgi:hypothetical protein
MIYISYLGVYDGQNFESANTPSQINSAIKNGFSCMVNLWRINNVLCVGTEENPVPVTDKYLQGNRYWLNVQNNDAYAWLQTQSITLYPNYFQFPNDTESTNVTTSSNKIITPGTVAVNNTSVIFLPEIDDKSLFSTVQLSCFGICSSYLTFIKRYRQEGARY